MVSLAFRHRLALSAVILAGAAPAAQPVYDPLAVDPACHPATAELTIKDEARQRELPILCYLPAAKTNTPVVLFSHGLGGNRYGSAFLGKHWARRGYVAVFLQHPGSDESLWRDVPVAQRMVAMRQAVGIENFVLRVKDVSVVLDRLEHWNRTEGHSLSGRLDLRRVGMAGHSFGAATTQAIGGQTYLGGRSSFTDPRVRAALVCSPNPPQGDVPAQALAAVKIPWMVMTGTKDTSIVTDTTPAARLAIFPALPPGGKYELVLDGAEHSVFVERTLPGETGKRNPNHQRAILALSTAFWDATLRGDTAAKAWLDGSGPSSVLEQTDRWQKR